MKKTHSAISNLGFLAILAFLAVLWVCQSLAWAGTITGQITTATNGPIANGTLTLTLNQYAVVSGTAAIAPAAVSCYTDAVGNVVGLPNPPAAPVLSVSLGSGSLPSGTYYVVYAWSNSTGTTFYSSESSILLTGAGTLIVGVPASPPAGATSWKVFIGTSSLGETQQISQGTPFSNYSQSASLSAGAALPGSNTTVCSLRFNDELVPSFTKYNVSLKTQSGATVSGFPMFWQLFGGNAGTINVSNGYPLASNAVVYPFPIVSNPNAQSTQSINGGLNLGSFGLTGGPGTFSGNISTPKIDNVVWLDGTTNTTLAGAYAALGANGGTVIVPCAPGGGQYTETLSANLVLSKNNSGFLFLCPATITMAGNQITKAGSVVGAFIIGLNFGAGGSLTGGSVRLVYTGGAVPLDIGDASTTSWGDSYINLVIDITGATNSSAVKGMRVRRLIDADIRNVSIQCANAQIGIVEDGTGFFAGDTHWINVRPFGCSTAMQLINANANVITGGNFGGVSIGIDIQSGNGNFIVTDIESTPTALNFANNSSVFGNRAFIYGQGNTADCAFGAAAAGNVCDNIGANSVNQVTASGVGTSNSVFNPYKYQYDQNGNLGIAGLEGFNGSSVITSTPPVFAAQNTGWKHCYFGTTYCVGLEGNTEAHLIAGGSTGWLSVFPSAPANNATATTPDSGAKASVGTDGTFRNSSASRLAEILVSGCNGTATASTTIDLSWPGSATPACTNTATTLRVPTPTSGTISSLRVRCNTGGVVAGSGVFTVLKNNSATALTCTTGTGATCADTTDTVNVAAGDDLLVQFTTQNAETLANCAASFEKW